MRELLAHIGLTTNTQQDRSAVGKAIIKFHCKMGYWDEEEFPKGFLKVRTVSLSTKGQKYALFSNLPDQWIRVMVSWNSPIGTRGQTGL